MSKLLERSHLAARDVASVQMSASDVADYAALQDLGINFPTKAVNKMAAFAMDDQQGLSLIHI
jgi:hypothetical protein